MTIYHSNAVFTTLGSKKKYSTTRLSAVRFTTLCFVPGCNPFFAHVRTCTPMADPDIAAHENQQMSAETHKNIDYFDG
jgi:hypothetical protein